MKQKQTVIIADVSDEVRELLERAQGMLKDVQIEFAPQLAAPQANGRSVELGGFVTEIDLARPGAIETFERLAGTLSGRKVVAVAPRADSEHVRRLFRAGAADVLTTPVSAQAVAASLSEMLHPTAPSRDTAGRTISVLKATGGAGATTLALNLARLLQADPPGGAAVLDLDIQFGDTDIALGLEPRSTVLDILRAQSRFDGRFLQGVLCEHASGLRLLAPPRSLVPLDVMSPAFAAELVRQSSLLSATTVVDLPSAWTDWTSAVLRASDAIVLVAPATVCGVVGARKVLDTLEETGVERPLFMVLNGLSGLPDMLDKPGRISRTLDVPLDATLAFDPAARKAADRGRLLVDAFPRARLARELKAAASKLRAKLAARHQPAQPQTGAVAA